MILSGMEIEKQMGTSIFIEPFNKDKIKHIYFIAETKGSMSSMQITDIEKCKVACAKELYASLSGGIVKYDVVSTFEELMMVVGDRD